MKADFRDAIQQVKEGADIVEIVGRYVPTLKRTGATYKGHCPFHKEKTPSFNVVPAKGIFHCFGCGAGGSVIDFVMRAERLEFADALRKLADELGVQLPERSNRTAAERSQEESLLKSIAEANAAALKWFRANLLKGRNQLASEYLPRRGITEEVAGRFQLGAAMDSWDALKSHLTGIGFQEDTLVEAGLCARSEGGRVYDRFRNRLIFPIWDVNGRVCGFGGRALVDEPNSPKYLNTGETALFRKNSLLYALNLGYKAIEETGYAILCEGYMDVVMAHAYGVPQAVASLGTGLTPQQARLLRRFGQRVYFLYDGDAAGQKAMLREGDALLGAGLDTRVLSLPVEDDPDSYLRREGREPLLAQLEKAEEYFDFALRVHSEGTNLATLAGQAELVEKMSPILIGIGNDVMREAAIGRLLRKLGGLPREAVEQLLKRMKRRGRDAAEGGGGELAAPEEGFRRRDEPAPSHDAMSRAGFDRLDPLERHLLQVMLEDAEALALIRRKLRSEWIRDSRLAGWIFHMMDGEGSAEELIRAVEGLPSPPGDPRLLTALQAWDYPVAQPESQVRAAEQLLLRLHERHQQALTRELLLQIDQGVYTEEEAARILAIYDQEHRTRIREASRFLRSGDSEARARYKNSAHR